MATENSEKPGSRMPTKAELNADISIDASPEEVARSLFPKNQKVEKSGKGEQVKKKWDAWLKSREEQAG